LSKLNEELKERDLALSKVPKDIDIKLRDLTQIKTMVDEKM
jgi:hypothetical protein